MAAAIGWVNYIEPGRTVTLNGNAAVNEVDPTYPLTNLLDPDPSLLALVDTTEDASSSGQYFRVAFGQSRQVRLAAMLNVYLSPSAALNAGVWARVLDGSAVTLESAPAYAPTELATIPGSPDHYNLFWLFSQEHAASYIDFVVSITASATLRWGAGHLWAGPALILQDNMDARFIPRPIDDSPRKRGPSGAMAARKLPVRTSLAVSVSAMPYATALGNPLDPTALNWRQMALEAGASSPVIIMPRASGNAHERQVLSLYGAFRDPPAYPHESGDYYMSSAEIEQIR